MSALEGFDGNPYRKVDVAHGYAAYHFTVLSVEHEASVATCVTPNNTSFLSGACEYMVLKIMQRSIAAVPVDEA